MGVDSDSRARAAVVLFTHWRDTVANCAWPVTTLMFQGRLISDSIIMSLVYFVLVVSVD